MKKWISVALAMFAVLFISSKVLPVQANENIDVEKIISKIPMVQEYVDNLKKEIEDKNVVISNQDQVISQQKEEIQSLQNKIDSSWLFPKISNRMSESQIMELLGTPTSTSDYGYQKEYKWDIVMYDENGTRTSNAQVTVVYDDSGRMKQYSIAHGGGYYYPPTN